VKTFMADLKGNALYSLTVALRLATEAVSELV